MKRILLTLILGLVFGATASYACPGASIKLNDDSYLTAGGLTNGKGALSPSVADMKQAIIHDQLATPADGSWVATDSNKNKTHSFALLGTVEDEGGIILSTYAVKDLVTGQSQVVTLHSNYFGNGARVRELAPIDQSTRPDQIFDVVRFAGCN